MATYAAAPAHGRLKDFFFVIVGLSDFYIGNDSGVMHMAAVKKFLVLSSIARRSTRKIICPEFSARRL